jgi:pilus assembly protein CpaC
MSDHCNRSRAPRRERRRLALMGMALASLLTAPSVRAARTTQAPDWTANAADGGPVTVDIDKAEMIAEPGPGATVFVANPEIADAQTPDNRRVLVLGRRSGQTTVYVFPAGGAPTRYAITVGRGVDGIAQALRAIVPTGKIEVFRAPNGMTVSGMVDSPAQAEALKATALQYLTEKESLNFNVTVQQSTQVYLQVRIAEVSRSVTKTLGFNWNTLFNNGTVAAGLVTGRTPITTAFGQFVGNTPPTNTLGFGYSSGNVDLSAVIDALQSTGLVTILAEPNLTAISGATASFLSGGEFPIPISTGLGQVSIEWKKFGISVDFTPTVLDANRISIHVRPEVSELSTVGAVTLNGYQISSVATRRAETTVDLASGQSFAIAGLFQNNIAKTIQQFPALGDLPILGALFRSSSFIKSESELVIIVTPYIVRPVDNPASLRLPTQGLNFSNELDQILQGRLTAADGHPHLAGPAGFMEETP